MNDIKLLITGKVTFAGTNEGVNSVTIEITEEQFDWLTNKIGNTEDYDSLPIKYDEEKDEYSCRAHSKYDVKVLTEESDDEEIKFDEIGKGSEVQLAVTFKEGKFKRKEFVTGYLKAVKVIELVEREEYNPFEDEELDSI